MYSLEVTFLVELFLLIENNKFTVFMCIFQHTLTLINVTTVVFQPQQRCHQCIVCLPTTNKHSEILLREMTRNSF